MTFIARLLACLLCTGGLCARAQDGPPFVVAGYLPDYRLADVKPADLRGVTDLIFFGLEPAADGRLAEPPVPGVSLDRLQAIRAATDCRLLISVGGWGRSEHFARLAGDPAARGRFIEAMASFCEKQGFAGVDYDWEHPSDADEIRLYRGLLSETRKRFQKDALLVTVAQASWQDLGKESYALVDRVHLMAYDHDFPQATSEKVTADVERLIAWGCPAKKIALGVPFYGRNAKRASLSYREISAGDGFDASRDVIDGYAFNGRKTIAAKTDFAVRKGLAGIMIWELGQDSTDRGNSLLQVVLARAKANASVKE